ncbi:circadian clock-controlled protein daywake-like [Colias croceus]|uniref:circadian clock-controlled protein daywake-like n=1 Tax=Colias crocea TaxID=72248 RepID=UPI001E27D3E0|nr:circadian clock-controlled protein daywake-like [Colias croceus]
MTKSGDTYELIYKCNFVIKGKYHYSGDILYFNLHGAGDTIITSKNVVTKWTFQLETINKDGKEYFQMKNFNSSINYEGRVHYYMTNLIPGNPEMSQTILTYMNKNWRSIAQEFGGPVFKYGVETILHNVYKLFDSVPKDNIIQP